MLGLNVGLTVRPGLESATELPRSAVKQLGDSSESRRPQPLILLTVLGLLLPRMTVLPRQADTEPNSGYQSLDRSPYH